MISQLISEYDEQLSFIEAQIEFLQQRGKRIALKKMSLDMEMAAYANTTEKVVIDCVNIDEETGNTAPAHKEET
jgi:hypothetical protein